MKKPKSERQKFVTRRFLISSREVLERALLVLRNLPIDPLRPLEIVAQEEPKKRNNDQNSYYWLRLGELADQVWQEGKQYNSDIWHEYARRNIMPDEITDKDGIVRSKWVELPDGSMTVISTTMLDRATFANYTTMLEAFGANLGCEFSADPRQFQGMP